MFVFARARVRACVCARARVCVCLFVFVINQSKKYLNTANVTAKHFRFQAYDVASEADMMEDRKSDASEDE